MTVFYSRYIAPDPLDRNWIKSTMGGNNPCILIKENSVLPNCVGYAWGRWLELLKGPHNLSKGNAENWWTKIDGYARGGVPKLGAIACWRKGLAGNSTDGAGHVSVVEDILPDGTIITSNSSYLGSRFYMRTITPPYNIGSTFSFQGFIYPPIDFQYASPTTHTLEEIAKQVIAGKWGNGADRKARLTSAGYDPIRVQSEVNLLLSNGQVKPVKSIDQIAQEVILGKWGDGLSRKLQLTKAGYDPEAIQNRVNQILNPRPRKSIKTIAKEVIAGKWGNGVARKQALIKAGYKYSDVQAMVTKLLK